MTAKRRFNALDPLRFLAALAVVFFHYGFRGFSADGLSAVRYDAIAPYAKYGYLGVDLFFIISGFVIAASLVGRGFSAFVRARARRLYPAFWVSCTLTAIVAWVAKQPQFRVSPERWAANLTLATPLLRGRYVDGVYWSLDVEIRFYALVACVILFWNASKLTTVLLGWVGLSILDIAVGLPQSLAAHLCLAYAPLFACGAAYSAVARKTTTSLDLVTLGIAIPASLARSVLHSSEVATYYHVAMNGFVVAAIVAAFHAAFVLVAFRSLDIPRWRWLPALGGITYPLYLIHQNVGFIALNHFGQAVPAQILLSVLIAVMIALAWLIYRYGEPAAQHLFDRMAAGRPWRGAAVKRSALT